MAFQSRTSLAAPSGALLNLYVTKASQPARAVVQINHGLAEHALRYARFAAFLRQFGFHTYAHDHRGHGRTYAPDAPLGVFAARNGSDRVIDDVAAVHERIAKEHPDLPIVIFGHSLGGQVALNYLLARRSRVAAAALWNINVTAGWRGRLARLMLGWERFRYGSDLPSRTMGALTFRAWAAQVPDRRTPFDWLSRDPVEVDRYLADPLCGWEPTISMWHDILAMNFLAADPARLPDLPVLLLGGSEDPVTSGGRAINILASRMRRAGMQSVEAVIRPGTRHESLNERNRDETMNVFVEWAGRALAMA